MNSITSKKLTIPSVLAIVLVATVTYLPALKIGFLDGWWYLEWAATFPFVRYLIQFFDPANITQGFRPVQGLYMYLLYHLFAFNPDGYHLAHNFLHAANAVLLFLLVWRLGKTWRLAFVAALVYAVLPTLSLAVFWHAVVDPLAAFFYLLTLLLWIRFIETPRVGNYTIAFVVYVFALLSKEIAIFLPLWLFLIQWWFYNVKPNLRVDILRYAPFVIAWIPYLYQVVQVQSHGEFVGQFGFRIGPHMLGNLIPYMAVLAFPWMTEKPTDAIYFLWLAIVALVYLAVMIHKHSKALLFLALTAVLNIAPLLGFPLDYFNTRYLYLSAVTSAILLALMFEAIWRFAATRRVLGSVIAVIVMLLVAISSAQVAEAAASLAEYTRQIRVPFRDISRLHPRFPEDTLLYFAYSPKTPLTDLKGLFMTRYGLELIVTGTDDWGYPPLRDHKNVFVYYFDDAARPREVVMDQSKTTRVSPLLPSDFDVPVRLEGYDVINPSVKRGDPLVLFLHWQPRDAMNRDYTVFVHLVDMESRVRAQYDSQPRRGTFPTSEWKPPHSVTDVIILPVTSEIPPGMYRLELGLYDQATMHRFAVVDARAKPVADKIVIESIEIR